MAETFRYGAYGKHLSNGIFSFYGLRSLETFHRFDEAAHENGKRHKRLNSDPNLHNKIILMLFGAAFLRLKQFRVIQQARKRLKRLHFHRAQLAINSHSRLLNAF